MKKYLMSLFLGFVLVNSVSSMEEPVESSGEAMITLKFQNGQSREVAPLILRNLGSLSELIFPSSQLIVPAFELTEVVAKDWDLLVDLLVEEGISTQDPRMRSCEAVAKLLEKDITSPKIFDYLKLAAFFDPLCENEKHLTDILRNLFVRALAHNDSQFLYNLSIFLRKGNRIPESMETDLVLALLAAKKIIPAIPYFEKMVMPEFDRVEIFAKSAQGYVAISGLLHDENKKYGVLVKSPDGKLSRIDLPENSLVKMLSWSSDGRLAILVGSSVIILDKNGAREQFQFPDDQSFDECAWSADGRFLAVVGSRVLGIKEGNDFQLVDLAWDDWPYAIGWSGSGKLAIGGINGNLMIMNPYLATTKTYTVGLGYINAVAWSRTEDLVLGCERGASRLTREGAFEPIVGLHKEITALAWNPHGALALGGFKALWIRDIHGQIVELNHFDDILSLLWLSDETIFVQGLNASGILYVDAPQEYKKLSLEQALFIVQFLAVQKKAVKLSEKQREIYTSLPVSIQERYKIINS